LAVGDIGRVELFQHRIGSDDQKEDLQVYILSGCVRWTIDVNFVRFQVIIISIIHQGVVRGHEVFYEPSIQGLESRDSHEVPHKLSVEGQGSGISIIFDPGGQGCISNVVKVIVGWGVEGVPELVAQLCYEVNWLRFHDTCIVESLRSL